MKPRTSSTVSVTTAPSKKNQSLTPQLSNIQSYSQQVTHMPLETSREIPFLSKETNDETILQKATHLVDSVANSICKQIMSGRLEVDDEESSLHLDVAHKHEQQESVKIVGQMLEEDEHKRLIIKFKHMSKKRDRAMRNRWQELSERSIRAQQEMQREKAESRMKTLEDRRKQIEKRLQEKKQLMKQISKTILQANNRFSAVKQKKCLYMDRQEQFYRNFTLPKLEQQQKILRQKHELMLTPIDIEELNSHSENYDKLLADKEVNRNVSMQLLQSRDSEYSPPQFVPRSYKIVEEEEEVKRMQEQIKSKQAQIYRIRRKEYTKKLDEIREQDKIKSVEKQRSKSQTEDRLAKDQTKQKLKPKNRQQTINTGNEYLKQLLKSNRNVAMIRKLKPLPQPIQLEKKHVKSVEQKAVEKQAYMAEMNKLQNTKIQQIVNSSKITPLRKQQILQHEISKLDQRVNSKSKREQTIEQSNNTAGVVLNCIEAKLALLQTVALIDKNKDKAGKLK